MNRISRLLRVVLASRWTGVVLMVLGLWLLSVALLAQEKADLTTPVAKTQTSYEVAEVTLSRLPRWAVRVRYVDNLSEQHLMDTHEGTEAEMLIVALNKADLTVKSLERRILEHLIAEGKIPPATISGTPREDDQVSLGTLELKWLSLTDQGNLHGVYGYAPFGCAPLACIHVAYPCVTEVPR